MRYKPHPDSQFQQGTEVVVFHGWRNIPRGETGCVVRRVERFGDITVFDIDIKDGVLKQRVETSMPWLFLRPRGTGTPDRKLPTARKARNGSSADDRNR